MSCNPFSAAVLVLLLKKRVVSLATILLRLVSQMPKIVLSSKQHYLNSERTRENSNL